jgi:site-specific recombinase XerD
MHPLKDCLKRAFYAEETDYLIPGENTEQLGERTVQEVVHEAAKSAGIRGALPGR